MSSPFVVLLKKELAETLRDRRTLALMVLLPLVVYPAITGLGGVLIALGKVRLAREPIAVAVTDSAAQALLQQAGVPPFTTVDLLPMEPALAAMKEQKVFAIVTAVEGAEAALASNGQARLVVRYTKRYDRSIEALERLKKTFELQNTTLLASRLASARLEPAFVKPIDARPLDIDFEKDIGTFLASRMLPILLLSMLVAGAMHPALDTIAGEKERGTLETLLVAPVDTKFVMAAKFALVVFVATFSTLLNLISMSLTFAATRLIDDTLQLTVKMSLAQFGLLVLVMVPTAILVAGMTLAVASLARSYRDGQTLMAPLLVFAIMPGIVATMPGVELNIWTACVPLLNAALLAKAAILGDVGLAETLLTLASVGGSAYLVIALSARAFRSEQLRFGGAEGWAQVFGLLRSKEPFTR